MMPYGPGRTPSFSIRTKWVKRASHLMSRAVCLLFTVLREYTLPFVSPYSRMTYIS